MEPEQAIEKAVNECIEEGILKDVLERERSAVMLDILTTFDEKSYAEGLREEGREEGRKEERENTEREKVRADKAEAELEKCRILLAKHGISYEE